MSDREGFLPNLINLYFQRIVLSYRVDIERTFDYENNTHLDLAGGRCAAS